MPHPASTRRLLAFLMVVAGATAAAITIANAVGGASCASAAGPASPPDLRITALPGVDLVPVASLPGVAASSGPFPAVETSIAHGRGSRSVRLEARPTLEGARRVTVATTSGPRGMHVAGGTGRVGYVLPGDLARVAPNERVHGSTLLLRLEHPERSGALAAWIARAYPGPQVQVARVSHDRCPAAAVERQ